MKSDFPEKMGAPALRALLNANIMSLAQLSKHTEAEIADLHGMGPKALTLLKGALRKQKRTFKKA